MLAQYLVVKALFGAQPELCERTGGSHTAHFQCLNAAIREDSSCSVHAAAQHLVFYFWYHKDFFDLFFGLLHVDRHILTDPSDLEISSSWSECISKMLLFLGDY